MDRLEEEMSDIAGLRIMCQFVEDIHQVVDLLRTRHDMKVIIERDYITNKKRAAIVPIILVIEYPVQLIDGEKINFSRDPDSYISDELLGNDRAFTEL